MESPPKRFQSLSRDSVYSNCCARTRVGAKYRFQSLSRDSVYSNWYTEDYRFGRMPVSIPQSG